jgi:hypothetical protein
MAILGVLAYGSIGGSALAWWWSAVRDIFRRF